jgi:hypothetical protein
VCGGVPGIPKSFRKLVGAGAQVAVLASLLQTIGQPSLPIPRLLQEAFQGYPEKGGGSPGRGGEYPPGLLVKLANPRGHLLVRRRSSSHLGIDHRIPQPEGEPTAMLAKGYA